MMPRKRSSQRKYLNPKAVLRLPDLDQAKWAVLNSLSSVDARRGYRHAIDEFVEWYCSEPQDLCAALPHRGRRIEQIQFLLGHVSIQTTERYLGCKQRIRGAVNDKIGIEPAG